jgi:hypothetical protein
VALTCPLGAAFSLIWVGTASSAASSYMLSGTGNLFALISRFVSTRIEWFAAAGERIILNAAPGTTWHVWQVDHTDGGNVAVYQDNVLVTSQAVGSTSAGNDLKTIFCQAATGAYATCKLGELAKFRAVLTTGERALAYGMLSQKWL